jgi:phosphatidylserine/phosphatidylglycerophosphate/cardiolipin synthase-like enzyme
VIEVRSLTDGGQTAPEIAARVAEFIAAARSTLELALYDIRLSDPAAGVVRGALQDAAKRGVAVRLAYNFEERRDRRRPLPPPPRTRVELVEGLPFPTCPIPGEPDLMHHKYVVRDREAVWTGSTNWTDDSWTRQENVIAVVQSAALAAAFAANFEELWRTRDVERSGRLATRAADAGDASVRPWFCPGQGPELAQRIAEAIGRARRRVRIASPVITSAPVLGTLAEAVSDGRLDIEGVVDATQIAQVVDQWHANGNASWKLPLLARVFAGAAFTGKPSTAWTPESLHDFMHAKVTVADDTVFLGSYNLSHSGELNAENVLEIESPAIAGQLAAFVEATRARYPDVVVDADPASSARSAAMRSTASAE